MKVVDSNAERAAASLNHMLFPTGRKHDGEPERKRLEGETSTICEAQKPAAAGIFFASVNHARS
jgi:hypothetical protein